MGRINKNGLDLLLLTDEFVSAGEDSVLQMKEMNLIRKVVFTEEDKLTTERKYHLQDYFRPDGDGSYTGVFPHRPSLALCDLATVAKAEGYEVHIHDNFVRLPWRLQQLVSLIRTNQPAVIGISTTFIIEERSVRRVVKLIRKIAPAAKLVLGGPTVRREESLHNAAEFVVFGSGELPMLQILEAVAGERPAASIPNIAYRDEDGTLQYGNAARKLAQVGVIGKPYRALKDDQIPIPDWSLYSRSRDLVYPIEFSRGCKYNCFYCSYDRGKVTRPLAEIREELERNAALGITKYRFGDSNFTDGPPRYQKYPNDVCQTIIDTAKDTGVPCTWSSYARVDNINEELADLMAQSGCLGVFFGVESGDDHILKLMRKGHDSAAARSGVAIAMRAGIRVHCNFVVGYPGETRESFENTLALIEDLRPHSVTLSCFFAEKQTPVFGSRMSEFNLQGEGPEWTHSTMDSTMANEFVSEGFQRLRDAGVNIGNELNWVDLMSSGLSIDDVDEYRQLQAKLLASDTPIEQTEGAKTRIRQFVLETVPEAVEIDQRSMRASEPSLRASV